MKTQPKTFITRGPVDAAQHYSVPRTAEVADLVYRIKDGRYNVIFAPRQTGKTTLFRRALDIISAEHETYFALQLDFQTFKNVSVAVFYHSLKTQIQAEIQWQFERRNWSFAPDFQHFLESYPLQDHISLTPFLNKLALYLGQRRLVMIIDEFDGIPQMALNDFLYTLRAIYHTRGRQRCPYSLGIVGVKSISQLNYDRSISPFNIQDDFSATTQGPMHHFFGYYDISPFHQAQTHYLALETDFHERAVEQADYDVEGDMQTVAIS